MAAEHLDDVGGRALGRAQRADDEVAVSGGDAGAAGVERDERPGRRPGRRLERPRRVHDVHPVAEHEADRADRVAQAVTEIEGAHGACRLTGGGRRIEQAGRAVVAHEHAVLAVGLRLGGQLAGGKGGGDAGEARQRGLVAAGVQREGGLVVGDREVLGRHDVAAVDAGGHQVPRDGVPVLVVEQRPRRDVEPGVPGQRPVVEVDRRRDAGEDVVGDHPEVGDAEQHVGRVGVEPGGHLGAGTDDGDPLLDAVVADHRVGGGEEHDLDAVGACHVGTLLDERLVTHQCTANGAGVTGPREIGQTPSSTPLRRQNVRRAGNRIGLGSADGRRFREGPPAP